MYTESNLFYLFIPLAIDPSVKFEKITARLQKNPFWTAQKNDTKYFFRYISDKFDARDPKKCQCMTSSLNESGRERLRFSDETEWEVHRYIGRERCEIYRFFITGVTLYRFRTNISVAAVEIRAKESDPLYVSTLEFWLKAAQIHPIYPAGSQEQNGVLLPDQIRSSLEGVYDPRKVQPFFYMNDGGGRANILTYLAVDSQNRSLPDLQHMLFYLRKSYSRDYAFHEDPETDAEEYFSSVEHIHWGISPEATVCIAEITEDNASFLESVFEKNFRRDYLFLYVLLLHQKYVLYRFLTKIGIGMHNNLEMLEAYRAELHEFETNFMFFRVTEVPQYQKLYEKICAAFSIKELYDDVDNPVSELGEQRRSKREQALNTSLVVLSLLACVSALEDGFSFMKTYYSQAFDIGKWVCSVGVAVIFLFVIGRLFGGKIRSALRRLKTKILRLFERK